MVPKVKGRSSSLFKQQLNGNNSKHWRRPNPGPQCLIGFLVKMSRKCCKNVLKIPIDVPKMSRSKQIWDISVYLQATTISNSKRSFWLHLGQGIIKKLSQNLWYTVLCSGFKKKWLWSKGLLMSLDLTWRPTFEMSTNQLWNWRIIVRTLRFWFLFQNRFWAEYWAIN